MSISSESKSAIRQEIERLQDQKTALTNQIKALGDKKDLLQARRVEINNAIAKLQADSN